MWAQRYRCQRLLWTYFYYVMHSQLDLSSWDLTGHRGSVPKSIGGADYRGHMLGL